MSKQAPIRVVISGGGTGGHIYPAIAIADAVREAMPESEILFVGAEGKMEMEKVPQAGYKIVGLWISGLQRRLTLKNLSFPFKVFHSLLKARKLIKEFKPDAAVGVGGYASGPTMKAAERAKVPIVLQEQNGYAGLTNKLVAQQASAICVAYPHMERYFPKDKIHFTGNPVRKDILSIEGLREEAVKHFGLDPEKRILLVLGGSLGAKTINESIQQGLNRLLNADYQVIWQTGKFYYEGIMEKLGEAPSGTYIQPFIKEMAYAYAAADAVVSRAGALSISELCLVGKPSIFVPSPNVAEDHQTKNAKALAEEEAAWMVTDADARERLVTKALLLLADQSQQQALATNIKKLGKPAAASDIARIVFDLARSNKNRK